MNILSEAVPNPNNTDTNDLLEPNKVFRVQNNLELLLQDETLISDENMVSSTQYSFCLFYLKNHP